MTMVEHKAVKKAPEMDPQLRVKVDAAKALFKERTGRDATDEQVLEAIEKAGTKDTVTETNAAVQRELEREPGELAKSTGPQHRRSDGTVR